MKDHILLFHIAERAVGQGVSHSAMSATVDLQNMLPPVGIKQIRPCPAIEERLKSSGEYLIYLHLADILPTSEQHTAGMPGNLCKFLDIEALFGEGQIHRISRMMGRKSSKTV